MGLELREPETVVTAMNFDLQQLSFGERFWLWRIRQTPNLPAVHGRRNDGMTQIEAAKILGISIFNYQTLERDEDDKYAVDLLPKIEHEAPPLSDYECCLLARRRMSIKLENLAMQLGMSHMWALRLEREADERLVEFWTEHGFTGFAEPDGDVNG